MKNEHTSALCPACGSDCNERDELEKAEREINRLRAAPQQAEPVWVRPDQLQKARQAPFLCRVSPTKDAPDLMPMFLHPPAAEVQRLREALKPFATIDLTTNQAVDAMDVLRARIDTADHVFHAPTGETWVVKYVRGDNLAWCGWPPGEAKLGDCTLVKKASSVERERLLREMEGK